NSQNAPTKIRINTVTNKIKYIISSNANQLTKLISRHPEDCLLVVVDLDYFKEINDRHGHLSGDKILKTIVSLIKESLREADIFGRLGGDEFSIIFRNCTLSEGCDICRRTIKKIKDTKVSMPSKEKVSLSVSLGVTPLTAEDNPFVQALARADRALYLAKTKGRGCFAVSPLDGGEPFLPLHSESE
ncbi:GGDEF domain-containing protein, partial [Acidithiobacillus ferrivorans]